MIIKYQMRPTMIRTNSRYRGQTEALKFANFVQETVHDIKMLGSLMDTNETTGGLGHSDYIYNNFAKFVEGADGDIKANIPSASVICHPTDDVFENLNLFNSTWGSYGNCSRGGTSDAVILDDSAGTQDPSGIYAQLSVEEGQIIYIRMGVRLLSGDGSSFTVGSDNITNGNTQGDLKTFNLPSNGSIIYIDKRLYCRHREPININIDIHRLPGTLQTGKVEISDIEIKYMTEHNVSLQSSNLSLKPSIDYMDEQIKSIISNM